MLSDPHPLKMSVYRQLTVKRILVGPNGVGKTSLVSSFFQQKFEKDVIPTVSPAFCTATIPIDSHTSVDLQIWDTAGQEQYQSISQMFYRESHIAFVCYDQPETPNIERWILRVREHAPDAKVYLVTTKADLIPDKVTEEVVLKQGEQFGIQFHAKYVLTSALSGRNVCELFSEAAKDVALKESVTRVKGGSLIRQESSKIEKRDEEIDVCCWI
jgi:small GTP-binding protein